MEHKKNVFVVMDIDRDTINNIGFKGDEVSDETMERIANYLGESFDDIFSDYLYEACEYFGIDKKEED